MDEPVPGLRAALDRAAEDGRRIAFWWRDDDAVALTAALDRLLSLSASHEVPVAIAAIPARIDASLPERLRHEDVSVLVHGWSHANHRPSGAPKAEFGFGRALDDMSLEVRRGRERLRAAFGERLVDVFVPPWNRISDEFVGRLSGAGFRGLSSFGDRHLGAGGLAVLNTHLDPVAWRGDRGLVDPATLGRFLAAALARSPEGPIGILTHHLVATEEVWSWTGRLLALVASHPAARPVSIAGLVEIASEPDRNLGRAGALTLAPDLARCPI